MRKTSDYLKQFACLVMALCMVPSAASAQVKVEGATTFALKARRVYTMVEDDNTWFIDQGMVFVKKGRIAAVGRDLDLPQFVRIIDLPDAVIMPGLVSANSWLAGQHAGEESVGPQYRAVDAFDPYAEYENVVAGGVTTVYLNPGRHRLLTGVGGVVKLGTRPRHAVLQSAADLVINLGERVFNPPPKQNWLIPPSSDDVIMPSDVQRPTSRLGQFLQLNESFDAAFAYAAARDKSGRPNDGETRPEYDAGLEALAGLLKKKITLRVNANRATDLEQAADFCKSRKHHFIFTGAVESEYLAEKLAQIGAPIIYQVPVNPRALGANLGPDPDRLEDRLVIPRQLNDLPIAIAGPEGAPHGELMFYAAAAKRSGLSRRKALEAVTSTAARLLQVDDRVGSIQPGRDADLLVMNGEPLVATTHVRRVYVNGRLKFNAEDRAANSLVVKGGRLWTGRKWIRDGEVLIEDGRVVAAGPTAPHPPHAQVIDAGPAAVITPGFIDARGHLGLEGDRSRVGPDQSVAGVLYKAGPEFNRVARSGVTTVLTSAYSLGNNGARITAIHTAGSNPDELIVKETSGLIIPLRGQDHEASVKRLRAMLAAGKKYDEVWKKYAKDLAEFKKQGPKKAEKKEAAEKKKKKDDNVIVEKPKADDITGTWKGTIGGPPLPEPQEFLAKLKLDGDQVEGSIETIFGGGDAVEVKGTYSDKHLSLEIQVNIPIGKPSIEADIDKEDHLIGQLEIGDRFSFDVEADRTEKDVPKIKIKRKRKKKSKDGAPEEPKKDEALEPYRDLFAGRISMVVDVDSRLVIESILPVFTKEFKVPFVLLNAPDARHLKEGIAAAKTGVILPVQPVRKVNRKDYMDSIDLSRAGIPVAFQSNAEDAARNLPDRVAWEVRRGLDATTALRALTGDAARMMRCDDEVGVLEPGRRGDLLIFDGPPLEPGSRLERVIINGREVDP